MRAHSSGRVTSFVSERDGVRWRKILHLTGCKILHLTGCKILHIRGYDVSDAVRTTLPLDISMSKNLHQTPGCDLCKSSYHLSWRIIEHYHRCVICLPYRQSQSLSRLQSGFTVNCLSFVQLLYRKLLTLATSSLTNTTKCINKLKRIEN
jgi:hypothetical protein